MKKAITLHKSDCIFFKYTPEEVEVILDDLHAFIRPGTKGVYAVKTLDSITFSPNTRCPIARNNIMDAWREKIDELRKDARASNERCVNFTDPGCRKKRAPSSAQPESPPLPDPDVFHFETGRVSVDADWFYAADEKIKRLEKEVKDLRQTLNATKSILNGREIKVAHLGKRLSQMRKACSQMNQSVDRKNMRIAQLEMKAKGK